jgi:AcrR family transcriptional regulator
MKASASFSDELLKAALRIIKKKKSSRGVSLRSIAKEAGCSHANAYNYVAGLQELLWLVVGASMDELERFCDERRSRPLPGESPVEALVASQYEFAFGREGLYRMLWFESPAGKPPTAVLAKILRGASLFSEALANAMGEESSPRIAEMAQMLHSFIHGQIAKLYSGRIPDPGRYIRGSMAQALRLFEALRTMPEPDRYEGWIPLPAIGDEINE